MSSKSVVAKIVPQPINRHCFISERASRTINKLQYILDSVSQDCSQSRSNCSKCVKKGPAFERLLLLEYINNIMPDLFK